MSKLVVILSTNLTLLVFHSNDLIIHSTCMRKLRILQCYCLSWVVFY